MTRTLTSVRAVGSANRRRLTAAIAVGLVALLAGPPAVSADSRSSSSEQLADAAHDALTALERWQSSGSATQFAAYNEARNAVAAETAKQLGTSARDLAAAWGSVELAKQHVILAAISQLGVPYKRLASIEGKAFDCSGLMLYAFAQAGIDLPRSSRDQYRAGEQVGALEVEPGDVVYYPGHISLYLGDGLMVHSPQSGQDVEVRTLFERSLRFADVVAELGPGVGAGHPQSAAGRA